MKMIMKGIALNLIAMLVIAHTARPQGSWNPPGADLSFPRTLLDSTAVPAIRETLVNPEISLLYQSLWQNATSAIPGEDSTDGARITRAMMAKEAAFTVLMNRKYDNGTISPMTGADRDSMIMKCRSQGFVLPCAWLPTTVRSLLPNKSIRYWSREGLICNCLSVSISLQTAPRAN